jgi:FAD/FMN-containing dehydrogenase
LAAGTTVTNWFGDLVSHPRVVVEATSVDDIVKILKDPDHYPSPVRAVGSNHSTSPVGVAEGGTLIKMSRMNRVLEIGADTVTVQAGAIAIDVAHELQKHGMQFYVNTEIGSLSVGSASCAGTKDASMPGEYGQVGSYIINIKMVLPSGELFEASDLQPDVIQKVRSCYGTFGIVYQATYRIRKILPMAVRHETFTLADFVAKLPALKDSGESLMYYMFPYQDLVTVEFRHYNPGATGDPDSHVWPLRNYMWAKSGPLVCSQAEANIADKTVRYKVIDGFGALWRFTLENLVRSDNTVATDQIIHYPPVSDASRYTFSLWAFPEETYPTVLPAYFAFCKQYYREVGYRNNMLYVGYRIFQDRQALLSYSWDGNVMTIDPVSTANPGWTTFLPAYNQWCGDHGGIPLPNQTPMATRAQIEKALGDRWRQFAGARRTFDPNNRLLNDYFRELLGE